MDADTYLRQVLVAHAVPTGPFSPSEVTAVAIAPTLRAWAAGVLRDVSLSGSYAKGTAVKGRTDVDLFISLIASTTPTLGQLYESLYSLAWREGWQPRKQEVSVGIRYNGVAVDLVPAKHQGTGEYHSLYRKSTDSWMQTNVNLHIQQVRQSQRTQEIRVLKIWRDLGNVTVDSFVLELIVLDALKGHPIGAIGDNCWAVLQYIVANIKTVRLVDPANTNNIVSDSISPVQRSLVSLKATEALGKQYWSQIAW